VVLKAPGIFIVYELIRNWHYSYCQKMVISQYLTQESVTEKQILQHEYKKVTQNQ